MKIKSFVIILALFSFCLFFPSCGKEPVDLLIYSAKDEFSYGEDFSLGQDFYALIKYNDNTTERLKLTSFSKDEENIIKNDDLIVDFSSYKKDVIGKYKIKVTYAKNSNISLTFKVSVNAKNVDEISSNFKVSAYNGNYDGKTKTLEVDIPENTKITYSLDGMLFNLDTCPSYKDVGSYTIYYKIQNYGYNDYISNKTIEIKKQPLEVKPKDILITYGETFDRASLSCDFLGIVENETINNFSGKIEYSLLYEDGNSAGNYEILPSGISNKNYDITFSKGYLKVAKAENELEISFDDVVYGEYLTPKIKKNSGNGEITYLYSLSGENNFNISRKPTNVGSYDIKCTSKKTINYNEKTIIINDVKISKATLTITPNKLEIVYNSEFNPTIITNSYDGFKFLDNSSVLQLENEKLSYTTNYQLGNDTGEYKIEMSGYKSNNYNIVYSAGKLIVTPLKNDLQLAFNGKVYDGKPIDPIIIKNPNEFLIHYSYSVIDSTEIIDNLPTNAGVYNIFIKQDATLNFSEVNKIAENVVISRRLISIEWENTEFYYDGKAHCPTPICSKESIVNNDIVLLEAETNGDCINASSTSYNAECNSILNSNYLLPTNNTCKFFIHKQQVDTPVVDSVTYDGNYHTPNINSVPNLYSVVTKNGGINAGSYTITLRLFDFLNYKWKESSTEDISYKFNIVPAENVLISYSMPDWSYSEGSLNPIINCSYNNSRLITYYKKIDEPNESFSTTIPTLVGQYNAKSIIVGAPNYTTVESEIVTFNINKVDAKYKVVDVINIGINSTINDIVLPTDEIGTWSILDDLDTVLNIEGINSINAMFTPNETYVSGYNIVTTKIYVNVIENIETLIPFEDGYITIEDCTTKVDDIIKINSTIISVHNAEILYSLTQNGEYNSQIPISATTENIGKHTIWIKVIYDGYIPYFTHITLLITE